MCCKGHTNMFWLGSWDAYIKKLTSGTQFSPPGPEVGNSLCSGKLEEGSAQA